MNTPLRRIALVLALSIGVGCATIGDEPAFPGPLQTTGVGPFRPLSAVETSVGVDPANPDGLLLADPRPASSAMQAGGALWYAAADFLDPVPDRDPELPETAVDWAQFGPRAIYRSERGDALGYPTGALALEASQAWEGAAVFDPWFFVGLDGSGRLYYAADGGIGLAQGGPASFSSADAPLLEDAASPTVIQRADGSLWMFFERDGAIGLATSSDGVAFAVENPAVLSADESMDETALGHPGAVVSVSPTGREIVRVYFEASREDGTRVTALAATIDGMTFERLSTPPFGADTGEDDYAALAPSLITPLSTAATGPFVTLLVATAPHEVMDLRVRAVIGAVAPAFAQLVPQGD